MAAEHHPNDNFFLRSNPFLQYHGKLEQKNPFLGKLAEAMQYDYTNCHLPQVKVVDFKSQILPIYEWAASFLVEALGEEVNLSGAKLLDLGCGTGASTRMLQMTPAEKIVAVDQSPTALQVARYKFHQEDPAKFEAWAQWIYNGEIPLRLREYWQKAREETAGERRVSFVEGNMLQLEKVVAGEYDGAIASHSLHWVKGEFDLFLVSLSKVMKPRGVLVWNTAADFVDAPQYPAAAYGHRYNDLMEMVCEEVRKRGFTAADYREFRLPTWKIEDIKHASKEQGFLTEQRGVILGDNDFQRYFSFDIPLMLHALIKEEITIEEVQKLTREVLSDIIRKRPDFGRDLEHKYQINPIFVTRKI